MTHRPKVVIVGGGFGGLSAARSFRGVPVDVTLATGSDYHYFGHASGDHTRRAWMVCRAHWRCDGPFSAPTNRPNRNPIQHGGRH